MQETQESWARCRVQEKSQALLLRQFPHLVLPCVNDVLFLLIPFSKSNPNCAYVNLNFFPALSNTSIDLVMLLFDSHAVTEILILAVPRPTVGYLIGCAKIPLLKRYLPKSTAFFSLPTMIGII